MTVQAEIVFSRQMISEIIDRVLDNILAACDEKHHIQVLNAIPSVEEVIDSISKDSK